MSNVFALEGLLQRKYFLFVVLALKLVTTLNMIFNVSYYSEIHNSEYFMINLKIYHIKMSIFYSAQTTNSTFVSKKMRFTIYSYSAVSK